jgi:hypothetical protein
MTVYSKVYEYNFTNICDFKINKNRNESSKYIKDWLEGYRKNIENLDIIINKIIKSKCNLLASYICPNIDFSILNLINKYIVWLFIYDDSIDIEDITFENVNNVKNIINKLELITNNSNNYNLDINNECFAIRIYLDLIKEIRLKLEKYYYNNFVENILKYFETCKKEIEIT